MKKPPMTVVALVAAASIVCLGLAARLAHVRGVGGYYAPHVEQEEGYYEAGIALLSCHSLAQIPDTTPSSFRAPLYPSFLALTESFFERPSPFHPRLAQALLSAVAVAAVFLLGWLLFSPLAGLLSAALLAFNAEDILSAASLNVHGFYGAAMLALGIAAVLWLERRDARRAALLGLMLAATLLCRPAHFPFPFLFAAACLWRWRFPEGRWRALLPVAAFTALFLAPAALRNGLQFGNYSPFDLKGAYVLLRSTAGPHIRTTVEQALDAAEEIEPGFKERELDGRPLHEALVRMAVRQIARDPLSYAVYCVERAYLFWRGLWLFLALAAVALWRRRGDRPLEALVLTAASLSGYAVAGGAEEYRASAVPLLCVVAGAALASLAPRPTAPASTELERRLRLGVCVLPGAFAAAYAAMAVFLALELRDNLRPGPGIEARDQCADGRALAVLETGMRQAGGRGLAGVRYDNMLGTSLGTGAPADVQGPTHSYWLARAEREARAGERAAALGSLGRAEAASPNGYVSRRIIALYRGLKEYRRAAALLERELARSPRDAGLWLERAELHARSGARSAALEALSRAESLRPDRGTRRRIAVLYGDLKEHARAAALLEALNQGARRDSGSWLAQAELEVKAGDGGAALSSLARAEAAGLDQSGRRRIVGLYRALKEYPRASAYLAPLLKSSPWDAGLWLERAEIESRTGPREAALGSLARAEASSPDAAARRRIAVLYRVLKEYARASALLKRLPPDAGLWLEQAEVSARTGRRDAALRALAECLSSDPDDGQRRRAVGLYRELGENRRAAALLKPLLLLAPRDPELWLERAELDLQAGARASALGSLSRAEALIDEGSDRDGELARRLALGLQAAGKHGRAVEILDALARRFPADASLHADKGLCEYLKGDAGAAIGTLETAIRLDPKFLPAYLTLGAVHAAQKRPEEALKVYDEGLARGLADDPLRAVLLDARKAARR